MKRILTSALILMAGLSAHPVMASEAEPIELLFRTPHLEGTSAGDTLRYAHVRESIMPDALGPSLDSAILLEQKAAGDELETVITMDADGAARTLEHFRGVPGNPILMVFMESIVGSLSRATGGSPFYIRNRLKEAFVKGDVSRADGEDVILMKPFVDDRNRNRMGPFAALEVEMSLDPARPGMFGALVARVNDATVPELVVYREEMSYVAPK